MLCQNHDAGVTRSLVFHTGTDDRRLSHQERNCLTLHVGAHQCAVRVVVFEERDHRGRNRYYLLRRNVHIVDFFSRHQCDFSMFASGRDLRVDKVSVFGQRFVRLRDDHHFFFVCRQIVDLVGDSVCFFIYHSVRCFDEAVLIDHAVSGQGTDQTDVRTFRRLDRTHSAVVGMVYVTHLEAGSFSRKTARSECRKSPLVCQLCQWIVLVHELRKLGAAEEFLDCRRHRSDVHQRLRGGHIDVLRGHSFLDDTFHSGEADTELVLQKLADRTQSSVA